MREQALIEGMVMGCLLCSVIASTAIFTINQLYKYKIRSLNLKSIYGLYELTRINGIDKKCIVSTDLEHQVSRITIKWKEL